MTDALLFVGDVSWDMTLTAERLPMPDEKVIASDLRESAGGVVANSAIAAARAGGHVRGCFRLGQDWRGRAALEALHKNGLDDSTIAISGETAVAVVVLDGMGEKRLWLHLGSSMYPSVSSIVDCRLGDVTWVHTAIYDAPAARRLVNRCRDAGVRWSIDLEPATFPGGIETIADHLNGAGLVFCNDRALALIGPDPIGALYAHGVERVVHSRGSFGAVLHDPALPGGKLEVAAPHVSVRDTTGAGDCLAGWLIVGLTSGQQVKSALRRAVSAASLSCTRVGGQESLPTLQELEIFLEQARSAQPVPPAR